mmetsp:Transcript_31193/g.60788  ORF Transcript_31193/g.60788 Transcript_31193/m.60788 type:complete len:213 (+) Transcript_31193:45-683(+)
MRARLVTLRDIPCASCSRLWHWNPLSVNALRWERVMPAECGAALPFPPLLPATSISSSSCGPVIDKSPSCRSREWWPGGLDRYSNTSFLRLYFVTSCTCWALTPFFLISFALLDREKSKTLMGSSRGAAGLAVRLPLLLTAMPLLAVLARPELLRSPLALIVVLSLVVEVCDTMLGRAVRLVAEADDGRLRPAAAYSDCTLDEPPRLPLLVP